VAGVALTSVELDADSGGPLATEATTRSRKKHQDAAAEPVLVMRRRAAQSEIAATLGEILPAVFTHTQRAGIPLAGPPFTRYLSGGPGLLSLEAGMAIAGPAQPSGEIEVAELPGGPAAFAVHVGPYDSLGQTHAAIERWIADHGHAVVGAPWEVYVTDPGEQPNPAEWRTEVLYPIREASRGS
jgi:AraC family transcriptional regulator